MDEGFDEEVPVLRSVVDGTLKFGKRKPFPSRFEKLLRDAVYTLIAATSSQEPTEYCIKQTAQENLTLPGFTLEISLPAAKRCVRRTRRYC